MLFTLCVCSYEIIFQQGQEQTTWVIDSPARVPYISQYSDPSLQEDKTGRGRFIETVSSSFCNFCEMYVFQPRNTTILL